MHLVTQKLLDGRIAAEIPGSVVMSLLYVKGNNSNYFQQKDCLHIFLQTAITLYEMVL